VQQLIFHDLNKMPINNNLPASDYTAYLKAKAIAAVNTREPRLNNSPVPQPLLNTALKTSVMAQRVNAADSVLTAKELRSPPANLVNHPSAKSTISWLSPGVSR
jgi:hypothetical protein